VFFFFGEKSHIQTFIHSQSHLSHSENKAKLCENICVRNSRDFARIFDKSKLLRVRLNPAPPPPTPLAVANERKHRTWCESVKGKHKLEAQRHTEIASLKKKTSRRKLVLGSQTFAQDGDTG